MLVLHFPAPLAALWRVLNLHAVPADADALDALPYLVGLREVARLSGGGAFRHQALHLGQGSAPTREPHAVAHAITASDSSRRLMISMVRIVRTHDSESGRNMYRRRGSMSRHSGNFNVRM